MISQCDVKHMTQPMKTITQDLNTSTYTVTNITTRPIGISIIQVIMSVSTFKTAIITYILIQYNT